MSFVVLVASVGWLVVGCVRVRVIVCVRGCVLLCVRVGEVRSALRGGWGGVLRCSLAGRCGGSGAIVLRAVVGRWSQ